MNISPDFSPSIKLMKPYFLLSGFFYLLSMISLFFIDPKSSLTDFNIVGWVHLYMIGFVMLAIFSAMAQLGPVVVETKHYNENIFRYLFIFITVGLVLMLFGFYRDVEFLLYGGVLLFIAMSIYAVEFLLTLKNMRRKTSITKAMKMSNFFLLFGIISGIVMALGFNGMIESNPEIFLNIHTYSLVVGFVVLLIMGISIILIPMFGYSKRISDNNFSHSFITLSVGVGVMILSGFIFGEILETIAYLLSMVAIVLYFYQLKNMFISRKRVVHDIWAKSIYIGFSSFIISFLLFVFYFFNGNELLLKLSMWLLLVGFFGFLIIGNFYKIIPFLVWFQIYSPLIEEQVVPMLHELVEERLASLQWFYSSLGLALSSLGILLDLTQLFYGGVMFLSVGAILFLVFIYRVLDVKE
ncbi:MAG: hypothetical protein U9P38_07850 [Campylobacterota bacterium]|nr:hypothetical protein [Campylobacterota bacterium]